jgi:hypothetical protein
MWVLDFRFFPRRRREGANFEFPVFGCIAPRGEAGSLETGRAAKKFVEK